MSADGTPRDLAVCLLGVGEAGQSIGRDLVGRGIPVTAWDPDPARTLEGAKFPDTTADAVRPSSVVLSLNSAKMAVHAAREALPALTRRHLYVDLNSGAAELKRTVADVVAPSGAGFVDAALMDTVPGRGLATRCLASGPGADAFVRAFAPLGMPVTAIGPEPGNAAARKLLRSVFTKGIAAAAGEAIRAGQAAGCEAWLRDELSSVLTSANGTTLERLLEGSEQHASRRIIEMQHARELLLALGVEPRLTESAIAYLRDLAHNTSSTSTLEVGENVA